MAPRPHKALVYLGGGGGMNLDTRLLNAGWAVDTLTAPAPLPTVQEVLDGGYSLFGLDYGYNGVVADALTLAYDTYQAGVSVLTTGNDTTSSAGNPIWTGSVNLGGAGSELIPTVPETGTGHPVSRGWTSFNDADARIYLTGVRASAVVVGSFTYLSNPVPAVIAEINPSGNGARYVHIQPYAAVTPEGLTLSAAEWLVGGYASEVLADAPVGYWRLGSSAADSSGNSRHGTFSNSPTLGVAGALAGDPDRAMQAPAGRTLYFNTPQDVALNGTNYTVEVWLRLNTPPPASGFEDFLEGYSTPDGYGEVYCIRRSTAGTLQFFNRNEANTAWDVSVTAPATAFSWSEWTHVVYTWNGTNTALYVNGVLQGTSSNIPANGHPVIVRMTGNGSADETISPAYDELAIYTTALSPARIKAHYDAGTTAHAPSTYGGAVLGESVYGLSAQTLHVQAPATVNSPAATTTYSLSAPLITAPATLLAPANVLRGEVRPIANLLADPAAVLSPAASATYALTANALSDPPAVASPGASTSNTVVAPLVSAAASVLSPAASPGPVSASAQLLSTAASVRTPAASPGTVTLTLAAVLAAPTTIHFPADVLRGGVAVSADPISTNAVVQTPGGEANYTVGALALAAPASILSPATTVGPVSVSADLLAAPASVLAPEQVFERMTVVWAPDGVVITDPTVYVGAPLVTAPAAVLSPAGETSNAIDVPVLAAGATAYAPSSTTSTSLAAPTLSAPETAFLPAAAPGGVVVEAVALATAPSVIAPVVLVGPVSVSATLLAAPAQAYESTVAPGTAFVAPPLLSTETALHQAGVAPGAVAFEPDLLATATGLYEPAGAPGEVLVSPAFYSSSPSVLDPAASTEYSAASPLVTAPSTLHTPGTALAISPPLLSAPPSAFHQPSATTHAFLTPGTLDVAPTVLSPATAVGGVAAEADLALAPANVLDPTAVPGGVSVTTSDLTAPASFFEPGASTGPVAVAADLLTAGAAVLTPASEQGEALLVPPLLTAPALGLEPSTTTGPISAVAAHLSVTTFLGEPSAVTGLTLAIVPLLPAPASVPLPEAVPGGVSTDAVLLAEAPALYTPGVGVEIVTEHLAAPEIPHTPGILQTTFVGADLLATGVNVYDPSSDSVTTAEPPVVTAPAAVLSPAAAAEGVAILIPLLTVPAVGYTPQGVPGEVTVGAEHLLSTSAIFDPSAVTGAATVEPDVALGPALVHPPATSTGAVAASADHFSSGSAIYLPGSYATSEIGIDLLAAGAAVLSPGVSSGAVLVGVDLLVSPSVVYGPQTARIFVKGPVREVGSSTGVADAVAVGQSAWSTIQPTEST